MSAKILAFPPRSTVNAEQGAFVNDRGELLFRVSSQTVQAACERWQHLVLSGWLARMRPRDLDQFHLDQVFALSGRERTEYFTYVNFTEIASAMNRHETPQRRGGTTRRPRGPAKGDAKGES